MRSKAEVEMEMAAGILSTMTETIERLELYWPVSKRGSNAQHQLDYLKTQRAAAEQCCRDALSGLEVKDHG